MRTFQFDCSRFHLWKREQQRLYEQYRLKDKVISRIERERTLGLATLQTVPVVAVPEVSCDQQVRFVEGKRGKVVPVVPCSSYIEG